MIKLANQVFYSVNHVKYTIEQLTRRMNSGQSRLKLSSYEETLLRTCTEYINKYGA